MCDSYLEVMICSPHLKAPPSTSFKPAPRQRQLPRQRMTLFASKPSSGMKTKTGKSLEQNVILVVKHQRMVIKPHQMRVVLCHSTTLVTSLKDRRQPIEKPPVELRWRRGEWPDGVCVCVCVCVCGPPPVCSFGNFQIIIILNSLYSSEKYFNDKRQQDAHLPPVRKILGNILDQKQKYNLQWP